MFETETESEIEAEKKGESGESEGGEDMEPEAAKRQAWTLYVDLCSWSFVGGILGEKKGSGIFWVRVGALHPSPRPP